MLKNQIKTLIENELKELNITDIPVIVDYPADPKHGDYSSNVALVAAKKLGKNPKDFAEDLVKEWRIGNGEWRIFEKIEVAGPGFLNFWIKDDLLVSSNTYINSTNGALHGEKIFIEYAHPNTHKEMHIGHMRTLITGEALARLAEAAGATVFRANYQGDIGLHVAKALYGIHVLLKEKELTLEKVATWTHAEKAHFLGQGYARGSADYEEHKDEIDQINKDLYTKTSDVHALYETTRQWSLDYYDEFYKRFYTTFDRLFFESEVADSGKKIVEDNVGTIFAKENGALVFKGEQYGLHTRVFVTQAGNPTYEGKEMGNALNEYNAFHFDKKIHVVGSEQNGYFAVVFKALELLDPEKFKNKQLHVSMGMVQFADRKMSSRTGDVLRVDDLIDEVKEQVGEVMTADRIGDEHRDDTIEKIAIGAIKYSVLQVGTGQNVAFDIKRSISLEGNSGPYLQYVYVRTQSVLEKSGKLEVGSEKFQFDSLISEERDLLRLLARFPEIVEEAANRFAPHIVCNYLFELAQTFNAFYQKAPILKSEGEVRAFRLRLTEKTGEVIKKGLDLLGIAVPQHM